MQKILYIDCFSGLSGDMMAGALLDLGIEGLDISFFQNELEKVKFHGFRITAGKKNIGGLHAVKFDVFVEIPQPSRNFSDIKFLIDESKLDDRVKKLSINIFAVIADAESFVHGKSTDDIHFHEVGAVDSIIDVICTSAAIVKIGADRIYCRRIPLGRGVASSVHGKIPVPAPATIEILKGVPVYSGDFDFEVTTPTGAAIAKVLAEDFCDIPEMIIEKTGNGAGTKVQNCHTAPPNILRLIYGRIPDDNLSALAAAYRSEGMHSAGLKGSRTGKGERLLLLTTNIDDLSPEIAGYAVEKLLAAKALDAWTEPVFMKKNRPAYKLCILCNHEDKDKILKIIFSETSTLGVRAEEITRFCLKRELKTVKLPYGEIKVKIGFLDGREITISPEYESCAELAKKSGLPLKKIYQDLLFFLSSK